MTAEERPYVGRTDAVGRVTTSAPLVPDEDVIRELRRIAATREAEAGHIDQAAGARYRQAQTELIGLIREEARAIGQEPKAEREALPDSLADWIEQRVAQLEQVEVTELEIESTA